jgi:hypothetical protein
MTAAGKWYYEICPPPGWYAAAANMWFGSSTDDHRHLMILTWPTPGSIVAYASDEQPPKVWMRE